MTLAALAFSEADWEGMALELLAELLGWRPVSGKDIAPGTGERGSWDELLIRPRLLAALQRYNPGVPVQYLQQALAEIAAPKSNDAITENHRLHNYLVDGYRLSYIDSDGNEANPTIHLLSPDPDRNDWLAVNQVTLVQGDYKRRFDVVLYCNGMPVSIIELKKAVLGRRLPSCHRPGSPRLDAGISTQWPLRSQDPFPPHPERAAP